MHDRVRPRRGEHHLGGTGDGEVVGRAARRDDVEAAAAQPGDDVATEEPGPAGDEDAGTRRAHLGCYGSGVRRGPHRHRYARAPMPEHRPAVGVVVLNYQGATDTVRCLDSLQAVTPQPVIVVVDNASGDGSVERIAAAAPGVELIVNDANLGFGGGCNTGIAVLRERGVDHVWLLNNDTTVEPATLQAMLDVAATDDRLGAVGSVIFDMAAPERGADVGRRPPRALDRVHPRRPHARRSGRLPHRRLAAAAGARPRRRRRVRSPVLLHVGGRRPRRPAARPRLADRRRRGVAGVAPRRRQRVAGEPDPDGAPRGRRRAVHAQALARAGASRPCRCSAGTRSPRRASGGGRCSPPRGGAGAGRGGHDRRRGPELERRVPAAGVHPLAGRARTTRRSRSSSSTTGPSTPRSPCSTSWRRRSRPSR